ncbi:hypothetical protein [Brevibacillus laterosporus]|uniref:hypothetical protein n=1 Tax=Brevibacillus laterosporus TaxID=1465 RepID=UPI000DC4F85F|nr:hypothetical protein [Brevibacillus laterosporus]AYB38889.1 hypothetical protein D5F52_11745 [Brevibacillus laterosporus]RAP27214.1 hypothetical protein C2W64_01046 [Brevibacillus laterosporus]TPG70360.1 hypothetical protein EEL31_18920 [Brevibacillus laterosporus]
MLHSSNSTTSTEGKTKAPSWLIEKVYEPKRQRTIDFVHRAIDELVKENQRVSLASVARKTKELDPKSRGVSESAILNNKTAKAYFDRYKSWKGTRRRGTSNKTITESDVHSIRTIDPNRDISRARQRHLRLSKTELVERILTLEQGFALQEEHWLCLNDDLLHWRLRAEKAEALAENIKNTLSIKDAEIHRLRSQLNEVLSTDNIRGQ